MSDEENKTEAARKPSLVRKFLITLAAGLGYPATVYGLFLLTIQSALVGVIVLYIANIVVLIMAIRRRGGPYETARGFLIGWAVLGLIVGGIFLLFIQACSGKTFFG